MAALFRTIRTSTTLFHALKQQRCFSSSKSLLVGVVSSALEQDSVLVRDFIHESLYHPVYGYFNKKDQLIFSGKEDDDATKSLINFESLEDQYHYRNVLASLYAQQPHAWSTPSEIFRPYFGQSVANYLIEQFQKSDDGKQPLRVLEVGGGNGTCAANTLDHLKANYPEIYNRIQYKIVDISKELHAIQRRRLREHVAAGRCELVNMGIHDYLSTLQRSQDPVFVVCMEVFDNLPHDKVVIEDDQVFEVRVEPSRVTVNDTVLFAESKQPLRDPWIRKYLELAEIIEESEYTQNLRSRLERLHEGAFNGEVRDMRPQKEAWVRAWQSSILSMKPILQHYFRGGEHVMFVPTAALLLLEKLATIMPQHHLIVSDFDELPNEHKANRGVVNPPVVQLKVPAKHDPTQYTTSTFSTYLVPKGSCDIFFGTNFVQMGNVYRNLTGRGSTVLKQHQFLTKHLDEATQQKMKGRDGFSPIEADYSNMAFWLS